ncbi:MAG: methyltransferase domain-containing protein [Candidatus Omnitrophica bacterium]|nr:methyltransferase domain-containing protein [Candidatus Omnitrophota bacterium]
MLVDDIGLLECIECRGDLAAVFCEFENNMINYGILRCGRCGREYPVIDSVGVFFRKNVLPYYLSKREKFCMEKMGIKTDFCGKAENLECGQKKQLLVSKNWEYQWEHVSTFDSDDFNRDPEDLFGSAVFWRFIPITNKKVEGKVVYVACGGRGREVFHIAKVGPSKIIINEIGAEIYSIPKLIPEWRQNMLLLRCDICRSPLKNEMADIAICDHALQHILDHKLGFSQLVRVTKSGGIVGICVYSRENNFIMTKIIEPLKYFLHKVPLSVQRIISLLPAAAIYLLIHLFYLPLCRVSKKTAQRLPLFEHMMFWSHNTFKILWLSCFDLIHAPISHHFTEQEIKRLVKQNDLNIERLVNTHKTLWSLVATKNGK